MPRKASARRYAQAVFQIALERDRIDGWDQDLQTLAQALEDEAFLAFLDSPQVTEAQKAEAVRQVLGDRVDPLACNLLALMASRLLAHMLPEVLDQYRHLVDRHRGIERAQVVTAVPLTEEERRRVAETLRHMVGKEVRLTAQVDPSIIGGLVAKVGDKVLDGSIRTRLQEMKRSLVGRMS